MSAMRLFSKLSFFFLSLLLALNCDVVLGQNRIIGGEETNISKFPFLIEITLEGVTFVPLCGATIISQSWALSAAHCFMDNAGLSKTKWYRVLSGTTHTKGMVGQDKERAQLHKITEYHVHEKYAVPDNSTGFDIAVFKVIREFKFNERTQPAKLPEKSFLYVDEYATRYATIVGWGCTTLGGSTNPKLLYADVYEFQRCVEHYPGIKIPRSVKCYGTPVAIRNASNICQGDYGGPLIIGKDLVIGVASMSKSNNKRIPGLFTSTAFFRDWIKEKTGV